MTETRATLSEAFALLLGRPLSAFDPASTFGLYHWDEMLSDEFFAGEDEDEELDFAALPARPSAEADTGAAELSPERWRFDHGRSRFNIADWEHPVTRLLPGTSVTGAQLGAALAGDGTPVEDLADEYTVILHRVVTDGSLFDAMAAATWTMSAPKGLVRLAKKAKVEPAWAAALGQVTDPALRAHLGMLSLTRKSARSDGAWFAGTDCGVELQDLAELPGHEVLAAWQFGEGQAASAVLRLPTGG